jgi:hypothetical protein
LVVAGLCVPGDRANDGTLGVNEFDVCPISGAKTPNSLYNS